MHSWTASELKRRLRVEFSAEVASRPDQELELASIEKAAEEHRGPRSNIVHSMLLEALPWW